MEGLKKKARIEAATVDSADIEHSAIALALAKEESAQHLGKVTKNLNVSRVALSILILNHTHRLWQICALILPPEK